jgi:hypothetical protein
VADPSEIDTDIEMVNEHSSNLGLSFKLREFDSWKYADDRYVITSLPAFHVYFGEGYVDTFYPDEKVLNNIEECIKKYEKIQNEKRKFIEAWKDVLIFWKSKNS